MVEDKKIRNRSTEVIHNNFSTDENHNIKEHLYKALSTVNEKLNVKTELKESYVAPTKGLGTFINKPEGQQYSNRASKPKLPQVQKISKKQSKIMELTNLMDNIASLNQKSNGTDGDQNKTSNKKPDANVKRRSDGIDNDLNNIINTVCQEKNTDKAKCKLISNSNIGREAVKRKEENSINLNESNNRDSYDNEEMINVTVTRPIINKAYMKQIHSQKERDEEESKDYINHNNEEEDDFKQKTSNSFGDTKLIRDEYANCEDEAISKENESISYSNKEQDDTSHNQPYSHFRANKKIDSKNLVIPIRASGQNLSKAQLDLMKSLAIDGLIKQTEDNKGNSTLIEINMSGLLNLLVIKDFEINKLKTDLAKEQVRNQKITHEYNDTLENPLNRQLESLENPLNRQLESLEISKLKAGINELTISNAKLIDNGHKLERELNDIKMQLKTITKRYQDDISQYETLAKGLFDDLNDDQ